MAFSRLVSLGSLGCDGFSDVLVFDDPDSFEQYEAGSLSLSATCLRFFS